jgi:hypothetical protein
VIGLRLALAAAATLCALLVGAASAAAIEAGPTWSALSPADRQVLAPLQHDWPQIELTRKQKWLEIAGRFPTLPEDEKHRVQDRMAQWARLTPAQRASARLQYQEVRQLPAEERQAKWQAYQALSEDERKVLAQKAHPAARPSSAADARARTASEPQNGKRNMVVAGAAPHDRAIAPIVVQAKPGATTTTMSTRATPPAHNQAGLPKIAATPGFVDPATLLPRRGPQGAASPAASSSADRLTEPR